MEANGASAENKSADTTKISKRGGARPNSGGARPGAGRPKGSLSEARKAELKAEATLKELARQHTSEAIRTLVEMMQDAGAPPAARVAAVKEILDRGHGKAVQTIAGDEERPLEMRVTRIELVAHKHCSN